MKESLAIGVDIGGSHITAIPVDLGKGSILKDACIRGPVNAHGTKDEILDQWSAVILKCGSGIPASEWRIGIAMPGPFDYELGISLIHNLDKYEAFYGLNVKNLLAGKLNIDASQIRMVNDAAAFLLGEVKAGAAKNETQVIGLTLGTGLGSALYEAGEIREGDLYCEPFKGRRAEDILCTRWFINSYEAHRGAKLNGVKDLAERAVNDQFIASLFQTFGTHLAQLLHQRFEEMNGQVVVIGGNVAHAWDLFIPAFKNYMDQYELHVDVKKALLGERAAMIGAACLWQ